MTWDICIATIEHRHEKLVRLLEAIVPQVQAAKGVGILVYRDNLEAQIGPKRQRLVEASKADYVSFIDDDDMVPDDHVAKILEALRAKPDYVGFRQRYTVDGVEQRPVFHSLKHRWWSEDAKGFYRGITHFNPIRRDLALLAPFEGGHGEDSRWSMALHASGAVHHEVFIDEVMHYHDESSGDGFATPREPLTEHPPLPKYPCVRFVHGKPSYETAPLDRGGDIVATERMFRLDQHLGVYVLAYRRDQVIPAADRPYLISDTERFHGRV